MLNISVDKQDLEEIENNYDKLSKFLTSNFVSFSACAFVLQTVMDAVDKAKGQLERENSDL